MKKRVYRIVEEPDGIWRIDRKYSCFFGLFSWWNRTAYEVCPWRFATYEEAWNELFRRYSFNFKLEEYKYDDNA